MKKHFFAVMMIAISAAGLFAVSSCSKDDDDDNNKGNSSCTCTEENDSGYKASRKLDPKSYGATNCSDLEVKLRMQAGYDSDFYYSCY